MEGFGGLVVQLAAHGLRGALPGWEQGVLRWGAAGPGVGLEQTREVFNQ